MSTQSMVACAGRWRANHTSDILECDNQIAFRWVEGRLTLRELGAQ